MRESRFLLITGVLILTALTASSQQFNGGMMAGCAATQVAGDTYEGFHKAGIFFGGFVNYEVGEHSSFQMELEFFQKGSRVNPDSSNNFNQYLFRTNYIELPVLYQYRFNKRFKLEAGPSLGFLVSWYEERDEYEIKGAVRPAAVSFQINAGLYVNITDRLMFNLRTNNSLLNIRSENVTGDVIRIFPGNYGQFNDCLVFSLFYQFNAPAE
jgi:hypothetical protein